MQGIITASQTPTITAGAYSTGDAVGELLTFDKLCEGGMAELLAVLVQDKGNQKIAVDLLLFNASITATADNAAIAISASDSLKLVGRISLVAGDYTTIGTNLAEATKVLSPALPLISSDNKIYGQLVTRGTPTYTSTSDLTVKLVSKILNQGA